MNPLLTERSVEQCNVPRETITITTLEIIQVSVVVR
jgi:hypothetical protein